MKNFFILTLFFSYVLLSSALSQTITYSYDNNGNRTSRVLTTLKSSKVEFPITEEAFQNEDIIDKPSKLNLNVYPNPTDGLLRIEFVGDEIAKDATYALYNLSGNVLLKGKLVNKPIMEIDIKGFKNGFYVLRILNNREVSDWKIVKSGY